MPKDSTSTTIHEHLSVHIHTSSCHCISVLHPQTKSKENSLVDESISSKCSALILWQEALSATYSVRTSSPIKEELIRHPDHSPTDNSLSTDRAGFLYTNQKKALVIPGRAHLAVPISHISIWVTLLDSILNREKLALLKRDPEVDAWERPLNGTQKWLFLSVNSKENLNSADDPG